MPRLLLGLSLLVSACPLVAQFGSLSTTHDGSVVYFDTALRPKGTEKPIQGRIWRIRAAPGSQPELVLERTNVPPVPFESPIIPPSAFRTGNYSSLGRPFINSDGSQLAFTSGRDCIGRGCLNVERVAAEVLTFGSNDPKQVAGGTGYLSRNGRFLLSIGDWRFAGTFPRLTDLLNITPASVDRDLTPGWGPGHVVADTGATVLQRSSNLYLVSPGVTTRQLTDVYVDPVRWISARQATIDAAGRTAAWTASSYFPSTRTSVTDLRVLDLATGADRLFLSVPETTPLPVADPLLSADGRLLVFSSTAQFGTTDPPGPPQLFAVNIDGTGFRRITAHPQGVRTATLSGDGRVVWYLSNNNSLHHVDVGTAADTQLIAPTPEFQLIGAAVGSIGRVTGAGLADSTGHATVRVDGIEAPVLSASPTELLIQIPWEVKGTSPYPGWAPAAKVELQFSQSRSPFESVTETSIQVQSSLPAFVRHPGTNLAVIIHQDWSAAVSPASPARPGEIIHIYATGLGPVDRPQVTGEPAPADPPARLIPTLICTGYSGSTPVNLPVVFAGLAPGLIGYYQVSLQLPDVPVRTFRCDWQGAYAGDLYSDL